MAKHCPPVINLFLFLLPLQVVVLLGWGLSIVRKVHEFVNWQTHQDISMVSMK